MNERGIRIISLEAKNIYEQICINGEDVGYVLPPKKSFAFFCLFKNILDYSLDAIELEKSYETIRRRKFAFFDEYNNEYTLSIINLKFTYTYRHGGQQKSLKELRDYFYEKGFYIDGVHYVRYKRSSGSSRQGKCLFIDERMCRHMAKWGECGLKPTKDMSSWEAYKALSLSAICGTVHIPLNGILFIEDCKSIFEEEVVSVEEKDGKLVSEKKVGTVTNDIWDGESLLDESVFTGDYTDKHMLLLRNKFFKSCAFKTKLQQWFQDKNITSVETLKQRGFITFATDISQIVMVTTPNSMKFLKFMKGGLTEDNIDKWMGKVDGDFGVVKYDKRTKFFGGKMVQTSYQFLNTLSMDKTQAVSVLKPSREYLKTLREDYDFMRYHFSDAYKREAEYYEEKISDGLAERGELIFKLMKINYAFKDTRLYYRFRNAVVQSQRKRLEMGHILLPGTNATLFGNGPEMLLALSGEFDVKTPQNQPKVLAVGEVACASFSHGKRLVCARSPHITMGNLYCATNNLSHEIWKYFDLGVNIVCVNAIGENIQQRLNGCDYDSDAMLITDDETIVEMANKQKNDFCVPVCNIRSSIKENQKLVDLDYSTSENQIGDIVNLSQKLNSILWDRLNGDNADQVEIDTIYRDICILAVLSGIEIDKAKRAYSNVNVGAELRTLSKRYQEKRPYFFQALDNADIERRVRKVFVREEDIEEGEKCEKALKRLRKEKRDELKNKKQYTFYHTAMDYIYQLARKIDYREGKSKNVESLKIIDMIKEPAKDYSSTVYAQKDKIICLCEEYKELLDKLYKELNMADDDEKETIYERIRQKKEECNQKVSALLTHEYILYLVLKHYENTKKVDWRLYAPLLDNAMFLSMLQASKEKLYKVVEDEQGEYSIYGKKYSKKDF